MNEWWGERRENGRVFISFSTHSVEILCDSDLCRLQFLPQLFVVRGRNGEKL